MSEKVIIELKERTYIVHFPEDLRKPSLQRCRSELSQLTIDHCIKTPNQINSFQISNGLLYPI